jgi:hypothetical protein
VYNRSQIHAVFPLKKSCEREVEFVLPDLMGVFSHNGLTNLPVALCGRINRQRHNALVTAVVDVRPQAVIVRSAELNREFERLPAERVDL